MNIPKGRITGDFRRFTTAESGLDGTAYITPDVPVMTWPDLNVVAVQEQLRCPIIGGVLYAPGTVEVTEDTPPGVEVFASAQPGSEQGLIRYRVVASFPSTAVRVRPESPVEVPADGAVDIADVLTVEFPPGTVVVVHSAERVAAEAASVAADLSRAATAEMLVMVGEDRDATVAARVGAVEAATAAEAARDLAVAAASDATTARSAAEAARDLAVSAGIKWKTEGGKLRPYVVTPS